jgi:hypothetical protein
MKEYKTSHGRNCQGNGQLQTCERCAEIYVTHINQYTWPDGQPVESLAVASQGRFCLRTACAKIPHPGREGFLGSTLDFGQGHEAFCHRVLFSFAVSFQKKWTP